MHAVVFSKQSIIISVYFLGVHGVSDIITDQHVDRYDG